MSNGDALADVLEVKYLPVNLTILALFA